MLHYFARVMPSHRKRIGFLPTEEVHIIIEKISKDNNYSQSKVTGILVEEALRSRGFLDSTFSDNPYFINSSLKDPLKQRNLSLYSDLSNNLDISTFNKKSLTDDIKMIHEFIEYKLFKKIMNQKEKQDSL